MCQGVVIFVNLSGQLHDISVTALYQRVDGRRLFCLRQLIHLSGNAVDEGHDVAHERNFGSLLNVQTVVVVELHTRHRRFFLNLFKPFVTGLLLVFTRFLPQHQRFNNVVGQASCAFLSTHVVKPDKQRDEHKHHHPHGSDHKVQLCCRLVKLVGTRLELAVLTCYLLKVKIQIAVQVAHGLVVECRIDHGELLSNGGHKVWRTIHAPVCCESVVKTDESRRIVVYVEITLRERSVSACLLIDVAIAAEEVESTQGKVARNERVCHLVYVHKLHLVVLKMFTYALQRVCFPIRIIILSREEITTHEIVELFLAYCFGCAVS